MPKVKHHKDPLEGNELALPYHVVSWYENKDVSGVTLKIQLVHPDGVSRGLLLLVPDEYLVPTAPGCHFVTRRLYPERVQSDE